MAASVSVGHLSSGVPGVRTHTRSGNGQISICLLYTSIVLGDALEGVIEDNVLTNSGYGILISAFGPYGGPAAYGPVINTDVLRNTIAVGKGNFIVPSINDNVAGIGISDFPGCLLSGLMIRCLLYTSRCV